MPMFRQNKTFEYQQNVRPFRTILTTTVQMRSWTNDSWRLTYLSNLTVKVLGKAIAHISRGRHGNVRHTCKTILDMAMYTST